MAHQVQSVAGHAEAEDGRDVISYCLEVRKRVGEALQRLTEPKAAVTVEDHQALAPARMMPHVQ